MNILVCGGAGYIGSHMAKILHHSGHDVVVFDNLSTGNEWAVRWGKFLKGDLLNTNDLRNLFRQFSFDVVMHFSAKACVGESVLEPAQYYKNNFVGTFNLLEFARKEGVHKFIFSSTAAIYGEPACDAIAENHAKFPINPYGHSKLMVERLLKDYADSYGFNSMSLRYFNVAGADPDCEIGESHDPETHLIPNLLKAASEKQQGRNDSPPMRIFGNDYPTPDGTCIRDYIHVNDICMAHLHALAYLQTRQGAHAMNLGNDKGFSILDVVRAVEAVVGFEIEYEITGRRGGDPARLVANYELAKEELQWQPVFNRLEDIISTAWAWHSKSWY